MTEKERRRNPRAYGVAKVGKTKRSIQRNLDRLHKREHALIEHRKGAAEPPVVVCVAGPPGVGKSTLIRSLVRRWSNQKVKDVRGPITVVASRRKRVTFIEVPSDINAMVDAAKIADLMLLMVDASFGFEMETFEMLNIMQTHGFPKVIGVLTHLDAFTDSKAARKRKTLLKHRFWTEVYHGAKLFYLSGVKHGSYLKREVHNLGLFVSRTKLRPIVWRSTHPYLLCDRVEDKTNPALLQAAPHSDRTVALFGFARGTPLRTGQAVHVCGAGDFRVSRVDSLEDPVPLPEQLKEKLQAEQRARAAAAGGSTDGKAIGAGVHRRLNARETLLYAPMSNVGGLVMDRDATYIQLPDGAAMLSRASDLKDGRGRGGDDDDDEEEDGEAGRLRLEEARAVAEAGEMGL